MQFVARAFVRRHSLALIALAVLLLIAACSDPGSGTVGNESSADGAATDRARSRVPGERAFVFEDVHVIPMDREAVLRDRTVVVEDGRIAAIGPAEEVEIPPDAERIDGRGRYLLPGFADLHIHPLSTDELFGYLEHGVTTALIMRGRPQFLEWRDEVVAGGLLGPTLFSVGPTTDGFPPLGWKFAGLRSPEAARCVVADQAAAGYDAIKIYNAHTEETLAPVAEAAEEAGLSVVGHIPRALGAVRAMRLGQDMIAHGEEFYFADFRQEDDTPDRSLLPGIVEAAREAGVWVTPMLSSTPAIIRAVEEPDGARSRAERAAAAPAIYHAYRPENSGYTNRPEPEAFVARNRIMYDFLQELTSAFHEAGVPLIAGTDAGVVGLPGDQLHRELRELVGAGLSPYEALRTATAQAGSFALDQLGASEPFGVIAPGARADLVLLEANPLEDIGHVGAIEGVMARGRWLPADVLASTSDSLAAEFATQHEIVDRFDSLAAAGRLAEAAELARTAQATHGEDPLFHESVVRRHAIQGFEADPEGAVDMLRLNAELYPDFHAVHTTLALGYMEVGDTVAARGALQRALELVPCDGFATQALEELEGGTQSTE